jgi:hypothetical protein
MLVKVASKQKQEGKAKVNSCLEAADYFAHIRDFGYMAVVSCSRKRGSSCQCCYSSFILD